jgi:endonuclease YncB( thermonuclease family)
MKTRFFGATTLAFTTSHAAIDTPAGHFDFTTGAVVEAGDTLVFAGGRYRLYGQQSCLRGTGYTDAMGSGRAYAVAEQRAREMRRGLWQFDDVHYPAILLGRAGNQDRGP